MESVKRVEDAVAKGCKRRRRKPLERAKRRLLARHLKKKIACPNTV